ncbi:MAG: hypothetical protein HQK93_10660, partial [Nitrospirae bacterium]|nr:hypothetical protein [Nitrospirota bacterium]
INDEAITSITAFIKLHKITAKTVSAALPSEWIITKYLNIPLPNPDALDGIMTFEIQRHIPFDISNVLYNYRIAGMTNGLYSIIIMFVIKEKVQNLNEALKKAGLNIETISSSSLCELNLISYCELRTNILDNMRGALSSFKSKAKQEARIVIYTCGDSIIFWVIIKDKPIVQHSLLFSEIIDIATFWTEITSEIEQYLAICIIKQIILLGDNLIGLAEQIKSTTNYKVRHLKKLSGVSFPNDSDTQYQRKSITEEKLTLELAPSIGASLTGNGNDILSIKIQPKKHNVVSK